MMNTLELLAFTMLSFVAVTGGIMMLRLKKVVHMVISLVFTFLSIAGIYVLLSAEFIAVVQVLLYSGAITIMMLFGIMLTKHQEEQKGKQGLIKRLTILFGIIGFFGSIAIGIYSLEIPESSNDLHQHNTEQIGMALYSKYVIPFELTSVLLFVALVGAIILTKKEKEEEEQ